MSTRLFAFAGGSAGMWRVVQSHAIAGEPLLDVERVSVGQVSPIKNDSLTRWILRGITSNDRYVGHNEKDHLMAQQPSLGRAGATCAALIPIRKNVMWWSLSQDQRREILEEQSRHIAIGIQYLPAIARRLHHCRDLSESEPFDFLTWFEYGPTDEAAFNRLVAELRTSEEWKYVDREIDIRLIRDPA